MVFGFLLAGLTWILIHYIVSGPMGTTAFGDEAQAGAIIATALIIVGVAIGSLGNGLLKLCEDAPDPPPQNVPVDVANELVAVLHSIAVANAPPQLGQVMVEESNTRPREGIADG